MFCVVLSVLLCVRGGAALARNRRAASVVAAGALMALFALAAVAINDSNERTELVYRSSLDNTLNPAAGSGKGGWATGSPETSWGTGSLDETYVGENADAPGIPCKFRHTSDSPISFDTSDSPTQRAVFTYFVLCRFCSAQISDFCSFLQPRTCGRLLMPTIPPRARLAS